LIKRLNIQKVLLILAIIAGLILPTACQTKGMKKNDNESGSAVTVSSTNSTTSTDSTEATSETTHFYSSDKIALASTPEEYWDMIRFHGVALVYRDGEIQYTLEKGFADRETQTPTTINTVYEYGSITKQVTAVAIMQLVEEGKLSTEDTLDQYIPEYTYASEITIHQLLNMTSGVIDYVLEGPLGINLMNTSSINTSTLVSDVKAIATTPITHEDLLAMVNPFPLHFTPGTEYHYSNTNYYFLGMIIERLSGMTFSEYVEKNIFEPLNIDNLYFDNSELTSYGGIQLGEIFISLPSQDETISYSVGGMCGSAEALLAWEKCVISRCLLTEASWNEIYDGGVFNYGYGWQIHDDYVMHSGSTLGYNTTVIVNAEADEVVIVLSNTQSLGFTDERPSSEMVGERLYAFLNE